MESLGLLLVRLGFFASGRFASALAPTGLEPRHFGLLERLAEHEGASQQALGRVLGLNPTRMVFLIDDAEAAGLVERRRNPDDRRSYALYLTTKGKKALRDGRAVQQRHEADMGRGLSSKERAALVHLLGRIASAHGLDMTAMPGPPPTGTLAPATTGTTPASRR